MIGTTVDIDSLVPLFQSNQDIQIQQEIISETRDFIAYIARKFQYRGEGLSDLVQIGTIGMLKAMENYDATLGIKFLTYATPMIVGEIKHHFRDNRSMIKIPRRVHERYATIQINIRKLATNLKKSPTVKEIALEMKISEEDVINCLIAGDSARSLSLDAPLDRGKHPNDESISLIEALSTFDHDISDQIIDREAMKVAMVTLNKNEKKVIYFTFYQNLHQSEIAERMSFSQAHVSRILINSLQKLKRALYR